MSRTIFCHYDQCQCDGLDAVPYPGPIGQRIYAQIGQRAWQSWLNQQTILINEHRLSARERSHRAYLEKAMCAFLFGEPGPQTLPGPETDRATQ